MRDEPGFLSFIPVSTRYFFENHISVHSLVFITGILVGSLLFVGHFKAVDLTLGNRTQVVHRLDVAPEFLRIAFVACRDMEHRRSLCPGLSADKVEPSVTLAPILAKTLVQEEVDGDGGRCCSNKFCTVILYFDTVVVHTVGPLACACTYYVDQVACFGILAQLYCRLRSHKVQLRELQNRERTCRSCIGRTKFGLEIIVRTIGAELPKARIRLAADVAQ